MAVATIVRADNARPEEPGPDRLLLAFVRLCRQLERPVSEAELRAAASVPAGGADRACLERLAARAGFALRTTRMGARALARLPTPFLIVGRGPRQAWLARARTVDQLVLVDPAHGGATACTRKAAVALGTHLVRLVPVAAGVGARTDGFWRSALLHRVRGVLWQIGLASVVINLLALATPLFMMTVYNKVINHAALRTLDVLAIGMVTLVGFELLLRALRGYITAHTGARLETAIGGDVVRHIVHLPLRVFEAVPGAAMLERVRQVDQLRQFLTGHLPLLIVDLAFVGLFVAVLFALTPALALVTLAAMPAFALLSALAQRRQTAL